MKKNLLILLTFVLSAGLFFTACDKLNVSTPKVDDESTQDAALGERAVGDVFGMVNTGNTNGKTATDCGIYTFDILSNKLTITFPTEGCTGADGVIRSGVIEAQFRGIWRTAQSSVVITFVNYKRDGKSISGTVTVTFTPLGEQPVFKISARGMVMTFEDGRTVKWNSDNTMTWMDGMLTLLDRTDDVFSITGTTNGTTRSGKTFKRVATALVTAPDCKWFTSGNLVITITDGDAEDIYNLTFTKPCGTVTIVYKGISVTRNFGS